MAFKLLYKCDSCSNEVWAEQRPAEWNCPCYIPEAKQYEGSGIEQEIGKTERKARYREQYRRNQFTWMNRQPKMYMGAFEDYKERNLDE